MICIALYHGSSLKRSGMAHVNVGSHSFICHPHVYPQAEWVIPTFTPQLQSVTVFWLVLISGPAWGRRLSWRSIVRHSSFCLQVITIENAPECDILWSCVVIANVDETFIHSLFLLRAQQQKHIFVFHFRMFQQGNWLTCYSQNVRR